MSRLEGKVAIITGSGRGIGREHARLFVAEGAKVVIVDSGFDQHGGGDQPEPVAETVASEIKASGGEAVACTEKIGSIAAGKRITELAFDTFGRLDILVNNAGILRDRTLLKMSEEEWDDVIHVHLKGTFTCTQAAAQAMKDQGQGGRIINTSSSSGLLGNFGQANYGAAKAGIHAFTRIAAEELARYNITVNAIAPIALTRLLVSLPGIEPSVVEKQLAPSRISPLVAYLASENASHITGQTIGIEGNELFVYKMMTSHGVTMYGDEPFTIESIGNAINKAIHW